MIPPTGPSGQPLAEFTDRLLARLIDGLILGAASLVITIPAFIAIFSIMFNSIEPDGTMESGSAGSFILWIIVIYVAIFLLAMLAGYVYEVEMMYKSGQTVGKRVMKIQVVALSGQPLVRGDAARRWLVSSIVGSVIPGFTWVDGLWQLWDQPLRQCLHDKFAKTVVVKCTPVEGNKL
ncbi:MAG: RDD family protein [Micromonosporaceae bacterium]|nr:RDD family protein [Micromonosporaceae bacterium]